MYNNNNIYNQNQNYNNMGMMGMYANQNQQNVNNMQRGSNDYTNPNLGMMIQSKMQNNAGINQGGNNNFNRQGLNQEKERQIQQIKSQYQNVQTKQVMNNGQNVDLVELSLQIKCSDMDLQIPMAFLLENQFPSVPPKIFIRSKLKHNLFEIKDEVIEFDPNNLINWIPNQSTLSELLSKAKTLFEQDPPKQEKIIEDVNRLLGATSEKDFRDLVSKELFSQRNADELKQLQGISFQELICSSAEYKKIGQSLMDIISFNEKTSNELIQKKENLENHKRSLTMVSDRIEALSKDYNDRVNRCRGFKDAFSKQNIEKFAHQESKNLDDQSVDLETAIQNPQVNVLEVLQRYYDTRKNFHRLNIIKMKLGELNYS